VRLFADYQICAWKFGCEGADSSALREAFPAIAEPQVNGSSVSDRQQPPPRPNGAAVLFNVV